MPNTDAPVRDIDRVRSIIDRRSANGYTDEPLTDGELEAILRAATSVPDHGELRPWRLVVIDGDARQAFGDALAEAGRQARPDIDDAVLAKLRSKAFVAPLLIAVCARVDPSSKIDEWEQVASAACCGYAMALAAYQLGLGAMWKSSPFHDGDELRRVLDMSADGRFLGWVNLGHLADGRVLAPRADVDLDPIVRRLGTDGVPQPYASSASSISRG